VSQASSTAPVAKMTSDPLMYVPVHRIHKFNLTLNLLFKQQLCSKMYATQYQYACIDTQMCKNFIVAVTHIHTVCLEVNTALEKSIREN